MLPQSFSQVPALGTLIPRQVGYAKCKQEQLWQFLVQLFPLLGAGWLQEKAGTQLQDIDGFQALHSASMVVEGEGSCSPKVCRLSPVLYREVDK